jgi:hypothetical protein
MRHVDRSVNNASIGSNRSLLLKYLHSGVCNNLGALCMGDLSNCAVSVGVLKFDRRYVPGNLRRRRRRVKCVFVF